MRSERINKRAFDTPTNGDWPKKQELEEVDAPGNKAVAVTKAVDGKTADWVGDLIKQTVQFLTQHKADPNLAQQVQNLPITRKVGPTNLQGPIAQFQQSGNASALAGELETLLQGKRSLASKSAGEEAPNEADAPSKPKTENEQPETFQDPKRPVPAEDENPEPSADNRKNFTKRVKLDSVDHGTGTPSAWAVDNQRETMHRPDKTAAHSAIEVDDTRTLPTMPKRMTQEEQMEQKKNASLEVLTPKTAEELDLIVEASGDWVGKRLATGTFQGGMPSFILAADSEEPIAVVSAQGDVFEKDATRPTNRFASLLKKAGMPTLLPEDAPISTHVAAEGGTAEEEETEEETTVDSVVVQLLEACKLEWGTLGEPVNPGTWPKEIERAILALNDEIVGAIQKIEDKLVEGEFYSRNVDEGVEGHGGSNLMGLNVAPEEEGADVEPAPLPEEGLEEDIDADVEKLSSKEASAKTGAELPDVTSTETRKALKHTQSLKDDIASKFFDFKKIVQNANDSSIVKNIGETLVGLKVKLEEVEKVLSKQLEVLETAETAIEEKKKDNAKKAGEVPESFKKNWKKPADGEKKEEEPKDKKDDKKEAAVKTAACPTCGAKVMQSGVDTNGELCPNCAAKANNPQQKPPVGTTPATTPVKPQMPQNGPAKPSPVKQYGSLRGLTLASGE